MGSLQKKNSGSGRRIQTQTVGQWKANSLLQPDYGNPDPDKQQKTDELALFSHNAEPTSQGKTNQN